MIEGKRTRIDWSVLGSLAENHTVSEIAEIKGCSQTTVSQGINALVHINMNLKTIKRVAERAGQLSSSATKPSHG